jgi:succinate-semialdehyde dehydrogenase/glutarate-semialdehyde dehydrogenase
MFHGWEAKATRRSHTMAYTVEARQQFPHEIISHDPNTGQRIGSVPICGPADVEAAVARAREAQPAWAALGLKGRTRIMRRIQDTLVEHDEELAHLVSQETGRVMTETYIGDVLLSLTSLTGYLRIARRVLRTRKVRQGLLHSTKRTYIVQEPMGVVAVISPYNFPVLLSMQSAFAALIAGNTVVNKPSEHTPLTGLRLEELFLEASLPENVFQVMPGYAETGQALTNAGVDKISFVGSTMSGRRVAAAAAEQFLPVTLEMGGVNAMIVLDDAPLDRAVDGTITWTCVTAGQACGSVARVYVNRSVVDKFTEQVQARARELNVRPETMPGVDLAAQVSKEQFEKIDAMVEEALAEGAQMLTGGPDQSSNGKNGVYLYHPTVLTDVKNDMTIMQEESFGPVMSIVPIDGDEEAIRLANDSPYGLTASIWTKDKKRAWDIANQLKVGSVAVNDHLWPFFAPEAPWGGVKNSGLGFVGGEWGLRSMVTPKAISYDKFVLRREFYWQPTKPWVYDVFRGALRLLYARKLGTQLKGFVGALRSLF